MAGKLPTNWNLFRQNFLSKDLSGPNTSETLTHTGVIAPLPDFPIEKGIAGPGLLAQVMVDKYVDHLPVYRQVQRFARENVRIPANTINGWQRNLITPCPKALWVKRYNILSPGGTICWLTFMTGTWK
ncbi:transposase [Maribellus comscasis]|uniref:Transposase n=1 Tax=Maribellus comscasis TaxID=2681766 RepID=A0A6I6K0H4_9BACT|nr:transposase [Maribellus comscasis]